MSLFSSLRRGLLPTALATVALTGCSDDTDPVDTEWHPTTEEVQQDVDAWQRGVLKTCSLDAIFPKLSAPAEPPREGWDLSLVKQQSAPNGIWPLGDVRLVLAALPPLDAGLVYSQESSRDQTGGAPFRAELLYAGGRCTVRVNDAVVFDDVLRRAEITGILPVGALSQPVQLSVVTTSPAAMGTLAPGAKVVDFAAIPAAIEAALMPPALASDPDALARTLAPQIHLPAARVRDLVSFAAGDSFYQGALESSGLPWINVVRGDFGEDGHFFAKAIVSADELKALGGADLALTWPYGNTFDASENRTSDFDIRLRRTGELTYELTSVTLTGVAAQADARAAACVRDRLARLRRYTTAAPIGPTGYYHLEAPPCGSLTRDLARAVLGDQDATAEVLELVSDARRAIPVVLDGPLPPVDGGNASFVSLWSSLARPVLAGLEARGASGVLTARPSRIVSGFLTSVAALDRHRVRAEARTLLVEAAADRALAASGTRVSTAEDLSPLTEAAAAQIGAALRSDDLAIALAADAASLIRTNTDDQIGDNAALTCLAGATLDDRRAALATLATRSRSDDAHATWYRNVLGRLLAFLYRTSETAPFAAAYCQPAFVDWAIAHAGDAHPPCVYQGVVFDYSNDCAP